jgi:hypothetical protein
MKQGRLFVPSHVSDDRLICTMDGMMNSMGKTNYKRTYLSAELSICYAGTSATWERTLRIMVFLDLLTRDTMFLKVNSFHLQVNVWGGNYWVVLHLSERPHLNITRFEIRTF